MKEEKIGDYQIFFDLSRRVKRGAWVLTPVTFRPGLSRLLLQDAFSGSEKRPKREPFQMFWFEKET